MINIRNVSKKFGTKIANNNLTINVKPGEVYGVLGPNGAGKTTLIRQLIGFLKPDEGEILINDISTWGNEKLFMNQVGYIPGELIMYNSWTGKEYIKNTFALKDNVDEEFIENLINYFDLEPDIDKKIKKMSKGMKQKIAIICATMAKPKYLILDEPTSGLDPLMQNKFNKLIKKLKKEGSTVILCSHLFDEVAKLCDRIGFIKNGSIIKEALISDTNVANLEKEFLDLYQNEDFI